MAELFTLENLTTLGMLTLLQAVLGFDNLLYISLESKRAPEEKRAFVRRLGIGLAVVFRIALLYALISVIQYFQNPLFGIHGSGILDGEFNLHSLIVLAGGTFILYTATKEIFHMMSLEEHETSVRKESSVAGVVFWIVAMNLVFSFDSILSAMALSKVFAVMAAAIVIGGLLMIWLADRVSAFLAKNRMYEVLGLFVLFSFPFAIYETVTTQFVLPKLFEMIPGVTSVKDVNYIRRMGLDRVQFVFSHPIHYGLFVSLVLSISDRAYLLDRGRVAHAGTAAELAADADRIEAGYLGRVPADD